MRVEAPNQEQEIIGYIFGWKPPSDEKSKGGLGVLFMWKPEFFLRELGELNVRRLEEVPPNFPLPVVLDQLLTVVEKEEFKEAVEKLGGRAIIVFGNLKKQIAELIEEGVYALEVRLKEESLMLSPLKLSLIEQG